MNDSLSITTTYSNSNGHNMSFLNNKRKSDSSSVHEDKNDDIVKSEIANVETEDFTEI